METDITLLRRYSEIRDAQAFAELVRRYAGLVYGAALRITRDRHAAEDAAQECFLTLAREAGAIRTSLPGWLHRTATTRALMGLRGEVRRRQREEDARRMAASNGGPAEPVWADIAPYVDEALAELPESLREPLVQHFLQQKTQEEIGASLGVDRSTISRRLDKGIDLLRRRLTKAGFALPAAVLTALVTANASQSAPPTLLAALGKVALAGFGGAAKTTVTGTVAVQTAARTGGLFIKIAISSLVGATLVAGGIAVHSALSQKQEKKQNAPVPPQVAATPIVAVSVEPELPPDLGKETRMAKVIRQGNSVWVEGLEDVYWGGTTDRQNSTIAAISAAVTVAGDPATYEYLMGAGGAAFRIQMMQPTWCPSSACSPCGYDTSRPALNAIGRSITMIDTNSPDSDYAKARAVVVDSIDRGWPVLYASEENGLVVGYEDGARTLLLRPYSASKDGYVKTDKWPWGIGVFGPAAPPPPREQVILESLKTALMLARTPAFGKYASGFRALDAWITQLEDDAWLEKLDQETRRGVTLGNAYVYCCFIDCRLAAARYLRAASLDFKSETVAHLEAAATIYDKMQSQLRLNRSIAPFPWQISGKTPWTSEMRKQQAALLRDAQAQEKQALSEIEKALACEGVVVSTTDSSSAR